MPQDTAFRKNMMAEYTEALEYVERLEEAIRLHGRDNERVHPMDTILYDALENWSEENV